MRAVGNIWMFYLEALLFCKNQPYKVRGLAFYSTKSDFKINNEFRILKYGFLWKLQVNSKGYCKILYQGYYQTNVPIM